jgi:hypothetical protein
MIRWLIPFDDFTQALKVAEGEQLRHLLEDFWICDNGMLLKSDIQGGTQ